MLRKTGPLGTKFNNVSCSVTGDLLLIEIHRWKEGMENSKCNLQLLVTADCTKIMMEATNEIFQKDIKGVTKDCFIFECWLF